MAACSFGASSLNLRLSPAPSIIQLPNPNLPFHGVRIFNSHNFHALKLSQQSNRCLCLSSNNAQSTVVTDLKDSSEVEKSTTQLTPTALDVESLVTQICDTTSIAEVELKLGGFRLYVRRDLTGGETTNSLPPVSAPIVTTNVDSTEQNGSASSPSLAITKAEPSSVGIQTIVDTAADEGLIIIQSPRVGYFRRSKTIKGKRAPPSCKEKQIVKEGQVVCFIEQLGGELPIESDVAGEVIKILRDDGEPVGYGDALIAILPSFPGIKKLQ